MSDNTTLNLWNEIYLITQGQKLTTDTALILAQTPRYRIKNTQLKLPLKTLVNLLASAIANEVRENGIISNMSHTDIDANIAQRFERELEDFVMRNAANVPRDAVEYVGANLSAELLKAREKYSDFTAKTSKAMTTPLTAAATVHIREKADKTMSKWHMQPSNEVLSLVCIEQCPNCNTEGYRSVRYLDVKRDGILQREYVYGITHNDEAGHRGKIRFHKTRSALSVEEAKAICLEIHQTAIASAGSSQLALTGIVDEIPDPPQRKGPVSDSATYRETPRASSPQSRQEDDVEVEIEQPVGVQTAQYSS